MAKVVVMPKLGLTMTEGTVSSWLKKEGDAVNEGEPLFEVETDKLTNTIEASASGILRKIIAAAEATVPVLAPIAIIAGADEEISSLGGAADAPAAAPAAPASAPASAPAAPARAPGERVVASPAAKKLAKEMGVDISLVPGTGPKGRVTEDDVKNYKAAPAAPAAPAEPGVKASPLAAKVAAEAGIDLKDVPAKGRVLAADILSFLEGSREKAEEKPREETVPMNGMRKAVAKNMLNSHMTSPTVTFNLGVDMSEMKRYRDQLKSLKYG